MTWGKKLQAIKKSLHFRASFFAQFNEHRGIISFSTWYVVSYLSSYHQAILGGRNHLYGQSMNYSGETFLGTGKEFLQIDLFYICPSHCIIFSLPYIKLVQISDCGKRNSPKPFTYHSPPVLLAGWKSHSGYQFFIQVLLLLRVWNKQTSEMQILIIFPYTFYPHVLKE